METPYYNVPNLQKIANLEAEAVRLKELIEELAAVVSSAQTLIGCRSYDALLDRAYSEVSK